MRLYNWIHINQVNSLIWIALVLTTVGVLRRIGWNWVCWRTEKSNVDRKMDGFSLGWEQIATWNGLSC